MRPLQQPRRVDVAKRAARGLRGDCYAYAFREAVRYIESGEPTPPMVIVHGRVRGGIAHAWIERGGHAYDWQTFAVHGAEPSTIEAFRERHEAREEMRYQPREVAALAARNGHHGPWNDSGKAGDR